MTISKSHLTDPIHKRFHQPRTNFSHLVDSLRKAKPARNVLKIRPLKKVKDMVYGGLTESGR